MAGVNLLGWSYRYVGPPDLRALVRPEAVGRSIRSAEDFDDWASALTAVEPAEPFAFVIDSAGVLRLAPRRSEHVGCCRARGTCSSARSSIEKPAKSADPETVATLAHFTPDYPSGGVSTAGRDRDRGPAVARRQPPRPDDRRVPRSLHHAESHLQHSHRPRRHRRRGRPTARPRADGATSPRWTTCPIAW